MCDDMPVDTTCAAFQPATLKPATLTPASGDVPGGGSTTSLSTGAIIGIIVGSVFAVVVIVAVVLRMRGRAGRSKQEMQNVEL